MDNLTFDEIIRELIALFSRLSHEPRDKRYLYRLIGHMRRIDSDHTDQLTDMCQKIHQSQDRYLELLKKYHEVLKAAEKLARDYDAVTNFDTHETPVIEVDWDSEELTLNEETNILGKDWN